MLRRWPIWLVLAGAVLATAAASALAVSSEPASGGTARAFGVKISLPGGGVFGTDEVVAPPAATLPSGSYDYPAGDGSVLRIASISATASATSGQAASATASVALNGVQIFSGELTFQNIVAAANAAASPTQATGDITPTSVSGATFQGQPITISDNGRIDLADWGYMQTLVQTVGGGDPGTTGYHESLRVLDIHITADHGGLPAGSEIIIGWAEAFAQASPETETVTIPASGPKASPVTTTKTVAKHKKKKVKKGPKIVEPVPPGLQPKLSRKGYVFPVYGQAWFSDSFAAPRADTVWHHGIDIFTSMGTPVLAVADGKVFSVGWNNLGGNRLWLRDGDGNEFYYAHLSAYSPLAVKGQQVVAGDVLGFVGNSGDAITTPPHLHFEVHPSVLLPFGYDGSAVDPYSWLVGLEHLRDVAFPAGTADWAKQIAAHVGTQQPGAVLLHSADISVLPRLDGTSLRQLLGNSGSTATDLDRG